MATNGPCGMMYRLKSVYNTPENIYPPDCMYKMRNIYSSIHDDKKMGTTQPSGEAPLLDGDFYQQLEKRQEAILKQLADLHSQVSLVKSEFQMGQKVVAPPAGIKPSLEAKLQISRFQDVVVSADPSNPPLSLWILTALMQESSGGGVHLCTHTHSSVVRPLPENILGLSSSDVRSQPTGPRSQQKLILTLIWKNIGTAEPELMVNPVLQTAIRGEANIARYLGRLLAKDSVSPEEATEVDIWLDQTSLAISGNKSRQVFLKSMNSRLGRTRYLAGDAISVADVVAWSTLLKSSSGIDLPSNVTRWHKTLSSLPAFCHTASQFGLH